MNRRQSFTRITAGFLATVGISIFNTCKLVADHFSSYAWPSYPKESTLRKHLMGKPHYLKKYQLDRMSFVELRELHDEHHRRAGGKPPAQSRLWMNQKYKKPQHKTTEHAPSPDEQYKLG